MATGAEILDIPVMFEFEGKTYKVSRIVTQEMEQLLADWVYQSALDRLERQRGLARAKGFGMSQEQYDRQMDRLSDNQQAGKYEWEGSITVEAMNQLPGNKMMTYLRFKRYDPSVTPDLMERLWDAPDELRRLSQLINPTPAAGNVQKKESESTPAAEQATT